MLLKLTLSCVAALTLFSTILTLVNAHPSNVVSTTPARRATVCNGHAELCNRSFGNVTFAGSHDSYAIGINNFAVNQDQSVMQQLNDGIRMLQMQAHNESSVIKLCHTYCSLYDGGTLEDYLKIVKTWLDANPNEVLSLLIVNIDNMPATSYDTVFKAVGLDKVSYAPPAATLPATGWPTLGELIDSGKRLLTFLDHQSNLETVPYLLDEFSNIWETAYDVIDPTFDCLVNRTTGDTTTQMYLINHFLDKIVAVINQPVPDLGKINQTMALTGFGSLGAQVDTCVKDHGRPPNFILVDFYEFGGGSLFQVAANINGVPYNPATPIAKPVPTDGSATVSGVPGASGTPTTSTTFKPVPGAAPSTLDFTFVAPFMFTLLGFLLGPLFVL